MIFNKGIIVALIASTAFADQEGNGRDLLAQDADACGGLKGCYLYNKTDKSEVLLTGEDSFCPTDSSKGWSVRCDTDLSGSEVVESITFMYDGTIVKETEAPLWMGGHGDANHKCEARSITAVEYLGQPGDKEFSVEGNTGLKTCFAGSYVLKDSCDGTVPNAPIRTRSAVLPAPTKPPTKAPTKAPTNAPTNAPSKTPTKAPTQAPTKVPTESPTQAPTVSVNSRGCAVLPEGNLYNIIAKHSNQGLQVKNLSSGNGADIIQWPAGENWSFKPAKDGYFYVVSERSALGLQISYRSRNPGKKIIQWPISGNISDQWCLKPYGEGYYGIWNRKSQLFLDVPNESLQEGIGIKQWHENGQDNQKFRLEEMSASPTMSPTVTMTEAERKQRLAELPEPPEMRSCARAAYKMYYQPNVPLNWQIEGINPAGESKFLDIQGNSPRPLIRAEERWWHSFSTHFLPNHKTQLRFVNDKGVAGPWHICHKNSPIGMDLDGTGAVERIEGQFVIDITGDGDLEYLNEWFAPTEGILLDVSHGIEGGIVNGHHMFGDMGGVYSDGFAKLTLYDDNVDGVVSGEELEGFAIWVDANSNAKLDEGELSSLADHNIVSIRTDHETFVSSATLADGSEMYVEDLWFAR